MKAKPRRRRILGLVVLAAIVVVAAVYGVRLWRYWDRHVSTDDAFVETHVSPVSARTRGNVLEVLVRDNQEVAAGAPLVRLDPRDFEVKVQQARAALAMAQGRLRGAAAGVPMTEGSTRSQVALAQLGNPCPIEPCPLEVRLPRRDLGLNRLHGRAPRAPAGP